MSNLIKEELEYAKKKYKFEEYNGVKKLCREKINSLN